MDIKTTKIDDSFVVSCDGELCEGAYESAELAAIAPKLDPSLLIEARDKANNGVITESALRKAAFYYGVSALDFEDLLDGE